MDDPLERIDNSLKLGMVQIFYNRPEGIDLSEGGHCKQEYRDDVL